MPACARPTFAGVVTAATAAAAVLLPPAAAVAATHPEPAPLSARPVAGVLLDAAQAAAATRRPVTAGPVSDAVTVDGDGWQVRRTFRATGPGLAAAESTVTVHPSAAAAAEAVRQARQAAAAGVAAGSDPFAAAASTVAVAWARRGRFVVSGQCAVTAPAAVRVAAVAACARRLTVAQAASVRAGMHRAATDEGASR